MTEAARVSIAIEATGLEKTTGDLAKLESATKRAHTAVAANMGGAGKELAAAQAAFEKATGAITAQLAKLEASNAKNLASTDAMFSKAMKAMERATAPAAAAVTKLQTGFNSDMKMIGADAELMASTIREAMGDIAPAVAAASSAISNSAKAMGGFEGAAASMARSATALEEAVRGVAEVQAKLADQFARRPANDNPYEAPAKGAEELRAKLNPLYAIGLQYRKSVDEIREAHAKGVISVSEMNEAISRAGHIATASQAAYVRMSAHIEDAGKRTGLAAYQMSNLRSQFIDMGVMLQGGMNPLTILSTQLPQIYEALANGPGGLAGGMKDLGTSITGLASKIGPFGWGAAAIGVATIAVTAYSRAVQKAVPDMDATFKKHDDILAQIEERYGSLGEKVKGLSNWQGNLISVNAGKQLRDLKKIMDDQVKEFEAKVTGNDGFFGRNSGKLAGAFDPTGGYALDLANIDYGAVQNKLKPIQEQVEALRASLKTGGDGLLKFATAMDAMYAQAGDDAALRKAIETAIDYGQTLFEVESRTKQLTQATWMMQNGWKRFQGDVKQFRDAMSGMGSFMPDTRSDRARIEEDFRIAMSKAKTEADERRAIQLRTSSLGELDKAEANRRAGIALDIKAISARTAEEKASIAGERARLELLNDPKMRENADEITRRVDEAKTQSMAASREELNEALRQQTIATNDQISAAQEELQLVGKSAGETARLRAEFDMLAEAKEAARNAGFNADTVELTEEMKRQAAAIGEATDALDKLNFQRDVNFRLAQAGRSEQDQRIAAELNSSGIDFNSQEGQSRAAVLRYVESVEKAHDAMRELQDGTKDAMSEVIQSFGRGESAIESFVNAFSQVGSKLFSAGFDKLFGGLFDGGQSAASVTTKINTVAASTSPARSSIERYPLAPLTTASESQITRAGNAFLDLIGRAEGTDKGRGYNETLAYGKFTGGNQNLTGMSLNQIDALQTSMLRHTENTFNSSALGRYQIVRSTLRGLRTELGLTGNELFSPELQDELATQLARSRGSSASGLRNEWEGLRNIGADEILSVYGGLNDNFSSRAVSDGVIDAQKRIASGTVPIPTQRPTTTEGGIGINPGQIDKFSGGMQALGAGLGIFSQGFQSQSPIMGGITGAISGVGASASLAAAFGMAAGPLAPVGAAVGALVGAVGGSKGQRRTPIEKRAAMDAAWNDHPERKAA